MVSYFSTIKIPIFTRMVYFDDIPQSPLQPGGQPRTAGGRRIFESCLSSVIVGARAEVHIEDEVGMVYSRGSRECKSKSIFNHGSV